MSSILKALKKLEDEKIARKPDSLNIDAEILRGDSSPRLSITGISLVAALVFICGSGATYFFMKKIPSGEQSNKAYVAQAERPSPPLATRQDSAVSTPDKNNEVTDPARQPAALQQTQQKTAISPPPVAPSKQKTGTKAKPVQSQKAEATYRSDQHVAVPGTQPVVKAAPSAATPAIKVNGIAYQEGGNDSVAVVNGISVSIGSMVEGANVEDIQRDRVRFSYGGNKFEVPLGKSSR